MRFSKLFRYLAAFVALIFVSNTIGPLPEGCAQPYTNQVVRLGLTEPFVPTMLKGVKIFPDNPLLFDFLLDGGDDQTHLVGTTHLQDESNRLIKYFLASLTIPEEDLWVNLSPYEADRIIPEAFGTTEMGRDLLAQDYLLKQLTASLMNPEEELGAEFWERVHEKAYEEYGVIDIPVDAFNKVWIVPKKAVVYENSENNTALVVESYLEVMLEEDYVAASNNVGVGPRARPVKGQPQGAAPTTSIIREVLIPEIEREVNEGQHFAPLRQIYHSLVLATWFKRKLREGINQNFTELNAMYVNQSKIAGVDIPDKNAKDKIYNQYLDAFKQGATNLIKEDYDPVTNQIIPRKYFVGGITKQLIDQKLEIIHDQSMINKNIISTNLFVENMYLDKKHGRAILEGKLSGGIQKMGNAQFNKLVEFLSAQTNQESGIIIKNKDDAFEEAKKFPTRIMYATKLGVDFKTVGDILKDLGFKTFPIKSEGRISVELVPLKGIGKIDEKLEEFFNDVRIWYENIFKVNLEDMLIEEFKKEFMRWTPQAHLSKIFSFQGDPIYSEDAFADMKDIRRYEIKDATISRFFKKRKYFVPPVEVSRLEQKIVDWVTKPEIWTVLKKYHSLVKEKNLKKKDIIPSVALEIIHILKRDWLGANKYAEKKEISWGAAMSRVQRNNTLNIPFDFFSLKPNSRIPPQMVGMSFEQEKEAVKALRKEIEKGLDETDGNEEGVWDEGPDEINENETDTRDMNIDVVAQDSYDASDRLYENKVSEPDDGESVVSNLEQIGISNKDGYYKIERSRDQVEWQQIADIFNMRLGEFDDWLRGVTKEEGGKARVFEESVEEELLKLCSKTVVNRKAKELIEKYGSQKSLARLVKIEEFKKTKKFEKKLLKEKQENGSEINVKDISSQDWVDVKENVFRLWDEKMEAIQKKLSKGFVNLNDKKHTVLRSKLYLEKKKGNQAAQYFWDHFVVESELSIEERLVRVAENRKNLENFRKNKKKESDGQINDDSMMAEEVEVLIFERGKFSLEEDKYSGPKRRGEIIKNFSEDKYQDLKEKVNVVLEQAKLHTVTTRESLIVELKDWFDLKELAQVLDKRESINKHKSYFKLFRNKLHAAGVTSFVRVSNQFDLFHPAQSISVYAEYDKNTNSQKIKQTKLRNTIKKMKNNSSDRFKNFAKFLKAEFFSEFDLKPVA